MFDGPGILGIKTIDVQVVLLDIDWGIVNRGVIWHSVNKHAFHVAVRCVALIEAVATVLPAKTEIVRTAPGTREIAGESVESDTINRIDVVVTGGVEYSEGRAVEN